MCVWIRGIEFGDVTETSCMLNVTETHLQSFIEELENLEKCNLNVRSDRDLYDFLEQKISLDDERTDEQVRMELMNYSKYEFLACGGESFDFGKSFVVKEGEELIFVFTDKRDLFHSGRVLAWSQQGKQLLLLLPG